MLLEMDMNFSMIYELVAKCFNGVSRAIFALVTTPTKAKINVCNAKFLLVCNVLIFH